MTRQTRLTEREWHRKSAVDLFNGTWRLLEKRGRTAKDIDMLIHGAHASRYHWGRVGKPINVAIGEWQVSHMYAVLGRGEPATYHAQRCLELCRKEGLRDFILAFAYEALARADAVAGRRRDLRKHLAMARAAGEEIAEEDDRARFFEDLRSIVERRGR